MDCLPRGVDQFGQLQITGMRYPRHAVRDSILAIQRLQHPVPPIYMASPKDLKEYRMENWMGSLCHLGNKFMIERKDV